MLRLIRSNTLKKALQQTTTSRSHSSFNNVKKSSLAQVILSNASKRSMSSSAPGKSNDTMLIVAGSGILATACAFGYYVAGSTSSKKTKKIEKAVTEAEESVPKIIKEEVVEVAEEVETSNVELANAAEITDPSTEVTTDVPADKLPEGAPYVIIGAGTAAHAACRAIRKNDPNAKIIVIGDEEILPYMRPPLSKELWFSDNPDVAESLVFKSWNGKERSVFFEEADYYTSSKDFSSKEDGAVTVLTGKKVSSINTDNHDLQLKNGETIKYEKLLIATGGHPKNHPVFENAGGEVLKFTTLFRNVSDFQDLDKVVKSCENVVIVGGGFLGSELACALSSIGKTSGLNVTQIYAEEGNMAKVLPHYLSEWTTRKVQKEGVDVVKNRSIKDVTTDGKKVEIELDNGDKVHTDHVIVCIGIEPNAELAKSAGLEVDPQQGGFRVNSELEARSDVWVAGDAACFYDVNLGRRRVEHHDHAVVSGRLAGENMTGAKKAYKHQSMFWSDLGPEVGYEAIGLVDSSLPTVGIWAKATSADTPKGAEQASGESIPSERASEETSTNAPEQTADDVKTSNVNEDESFGKGVVFYMKEKKIVGILLWNIFSQMPIARRIISEQKDHDDLNSVAKLFNIHQ